MGLVEGKLYRPDGSFVEANAANKAAHLPDPSFYKLSQFSDLPLKSVREHTISSPLPWATKVVTS